MPARPPPSFLLCLACPSRRRGCCSPWPSTTSLPRDGPFRAASSSLPSPTPCHQTETLLRQLERSHRDRSKMSTFCASLRELFEVPARLGRFPGDWELGV